MKTDGLSINLATVRHQFNLKTGVEACLRHGITAISPWPMHTFAVSPSRQSRELTRAMLGKLLAESGGAEVLAKRFAAFFGPKHIQWCVVAMALAAVAAVLRLPRPSLKKTRTVCRPLAAASVQALLVS